MIVYRLLGRTFFPLGLLSLLALILLPSRTKDDRSVRHAAPHVPATVEPVTVAAIADSPDHHRAASVLEVLQRDFARTVELEQVPGQKPEEPQPNPLLRALCAARGNQFERTSSSVPGFTLLAGGSTTPRSPWTTLGTGLRQFYPLHYEDPMQIASDELNSVSMAPAWSTTGQGTIVDGAVVYSNVSPGIDVVRFPETDRTEEFLLVQNAEALREFRFSLELSANLRTIRAIGGFHEFRDADGVARLRLHPLEAWDADGKILSVHSELRGTRTLRREPDGSEILDPISGVELALSVPESGRFPLLIDPIWSTTGSMALGRRYAAGTLLPNGEFLICGGLSGLENVATAEVYSPLTGTWRSTASMTLVRRSHSALTLPNGLALVVGGYGTTDARQSAELYDPALGTWRRTRTDANHPGRYNHTTTLLNNGKVLLVGGHYSDSGGEIFDPAGETWSDTGPIPENYYDHASVLLPDGRVLLSGGFTGASNSSACYLYDPDTNAWTRTASLNSTRQEHCATLLYDGRVLVSGGYTSLGYTSSCEIYDPVRGTWQTTVGAMQKRRNLFCTTLLPNGKVLAVGGGGDSTADDSSEVFDPKLNQWSDLQTLSVPHTNPIAALLRNGSVLIAGGGTSINSMRCDLYQGLSGSMTAGTSLPLARRLHSATLLPSGLTLIAGGDVGGNSTPSCLLYDAEHGTWMPTDPLATPRHLHTATLLNSGTVLVAGGGGGLRSCERYDYVSGRWSPTGLLNTPRTYHTATALPDGRVLVVGGYDGTRAVATAEIYNPVTGDWTAVTTPMSAARYQHGATLLADGRILISGGFSGTAALRTCEIFSPSTGTWSATSPLTTARYLHSVTFMPDGRLLAVGGNTGTGPTPSCEWFIPSTGAWTPLSQGLSQARESHAVTLLPDGNLLATGGNPTAVSPELFCLNTQRWEPVPGVAGRYHHTATLLLNGRVLIAGGWDGRTLYDSVQLYDARPYAHLQMLPSISAVNGKSSFPVPVQFGTAVTVTGTSLRGSTEASGGGVRSVPVNYPSAMLSRLDSRSGNGWEGGGNGTFLTRPASNWLSGTQLSFTAPAATEANTHYYLLWVSSAGTYGTGKIVKITHDDSDPLAGTVSDGTGPDIDSQGDTTSLSANWTGFSDPQSGVLYYEWAIGTTPGGAETRPFMQVGTSTTATATGLTLIDGTTYFVTVRATNGGSLTSTSTSDGITISLNSPPTLAGLLPGANALLTTRRPAFSASVSAPEAGQRVHLDISLDGQAYAHGPDVTLTGTSSWTPAADLAEGAHSFRARAHDELGSFSAETTRSFTIDTLPPSVATNALLAPNGGEIWIAGSVRSIRWNPAAVTDANLGAAPIELRLSVDGGATFPFPLATGLPNSGTYDWTVPAQESTRCRVRIVATDAAGNSSPSSLDVSDADFSIDSSAPRVLDLRAGIADGGYGATTVIPIRIRFSEAVLVNTAAGTPTLSLSVLPSGASARYVSSFSPDTLTFEYTVQPGQSAADLDYTSPSALLLNGAFIRDAAGNDANVTLPPVGGPGSLGYNSGIVIDTSAPDTTITARPSSPSRDSSASISFTASKSNCTFRRRIDGGSWFTATSPDTVSGLGDGSHLYEVKAVDAAGNEDPTPASCTWIVDSIAPAAPTSVSYSPNPNDTGTQAVSWNPVTDSGSSIEGYDLRLSRDGGATWEIAATGVPGLTWIQSPALPQGRYVYQVRATDAAGNVGGYSTNLNYVDVIVDTTPPVAGTVNDGFFSDVEWQASLSSIAANWRGFTDPESAIRTYRWAVGTTPGASDVLPFRDAGNVPAAVADAALTEGVRYYVTVEAVNGVGLTTRVSSNGVTVDSVAPDAPVLLSPTDGATFASTSGVRFDWESVSDSGTYRLEVDTDTSFAAPLALSITVTSTEFTSGAFSAGRYHARLFATDAAGNTSLPSPVVSFSITGSSPFRISLGAASPAPTQELNTAQSLSLTQFRFEAGPLEGVRLNSLTLTAFGSADDARDLRSVRLYHDLNGNGYWDAPDVQLSSPQSFLTENGSLTFAELHHGIPAGEESLLIVVCDLSGTAPIGSTLGVKIALNTHVNATGIFTSTTLLPSGDFPLEGGVVTIVSSGTPGALSVLPGPAFPVDSYVAPAEPSVEFAQIQIHVSSLEAIRMTGLRLHASGTGDDAADLSSVFLACDENSNGIFNPGVDEVIAVSRYSTDNGDLLFPFTRDLEAGSTHQWIVAVDLAGSAALDKTFTFSLDPSVDLAATGLTSGSPIAPFGTRISAAVATVGGIGYGGSLTVSPLPFEPSSPVYPFARSILLLRFQLAAGGLEDVLVSHLRLRSEGSGDDSSAIQRLLLWEDRDNNDEFSPDADQQIGTIEGAFPGDDGVVTFFNLDRTIAAGSIRTWFVTYDFSGFARGGSTYRLLLDSTATPALALTGTASRLVITPQGDTVAGPFVEITSLPSSSGKKSSKTCVSSASSSEAAQDCPYPILFVLFLSAIFLQGRRNFSYGK